MDESIIEEHANLENELARVLREEIDKEILIETMVDNGWTRVSLEGIVDLFQDTGSIEYWIDENCRGRHSFFTPCIWLFEQPQDAELFILKWT